MRQRKYSMRRVATVAAAVCVAVVAALWGGSSYMLGYSLDPDPNRADTDSAYALLCERLPDMRQWTDSLRRNGLLRDTFVAMPDGERHHGKGIDDVGGGVAEIAHTLPDKDLVDDII